VRLFITLVGIMTDRSNLVSNSIKFTSKGSVRIVTKLLYPRMEPTPGSEIDDPLVEAARNLQAAQEMEEATRMERLAAVGLGGGYDAEKGSVRIEAKRLSGAKDREKAALGHHEEEKKKTTKAVVRVEVHDTGVGLRKSDIIE
jgi:signal transduction histidine kinase